MKLSKKISFAAFCADILDEPISPGWVAEYKAFDGERLGLVVGKILGGADERQEADETDYERGPRPDI